VAKRLLRREHIVSASLVGAVVVVIGFASGLGARPGSGAEAAQLPGDNEQPAPTAPVTTTQTQPAQGGSRNQSGGGSRNGGGAGPVTTAPPATTGTHHTGQPTTPPVTTTPPPTGTTPPVQCDPGLVPAALDTLHRRARPPRARPGLYTCRAAGTAGGHPARPAHRHLPGTNDNTDGPNDHDRTVRTRRMTVEGAAMRQAAPATRTWQGG
jgi:hypothetical protein